MICHITPYITIVVSVVIILPALANPAITGVTAQQRYPWNGKVDITYTVSGDIAAAANAQAAISMLKITATDQETGTTYTATSLSGDTGLTDGMHNFVWDMDAQGLTLKSTNVVFSVSCEMTVPYCIIDLSSGASAESYSVTYLAEPPLGGFNVDEFKTTKLVLKRIEAGSFQMGYEGDPVGVTLTQPFYIGLFEVTQKQWQLVTGSNPSRHYGAGDRKPVDTVSYDDIRGSSDGAQWPASNAVDADSFLGKLRARTGINFDLPTEAQWEYACRAGTTTAYSYGDSANENYMWWMNNSPDQTHDVGMKLPNPWGLYDMHGNVQEWCLDWYPDPYRLSGGTDPKGSSTGLNRMLCGGCWNYPAYYCDSTSIRYSTPSSGIYDDGFRLVWTLSETASAATLCSGSSTPTIIDLTQGIRTAALAETIRYSTVWDTSASGAEAVIAVNGETVNTAIRSGAFAWAPTRNGTYTLTHRVLVNGEQVGLTQTATFEFNHCPSKPVISPANGTILSGTANVVISCGTEGATIHYTTDGTDPTPDSPVYRRFRVSGRTTVKAIAVKNGLCSEVVIAEYALGRCKAPVITAASTFSGANTSVKLSCPTESATIRYTTDGSDPDANATPYTGPFEVTNSCTVKAYATYESFFDSAISSFAIEKVWGIGDTMGAPDQSFTAGGDLPFVRVDDATAPLGESMKSGAITHEQTSSLSTTVDGPGTVSFQWKTSCEDSGGQYDWDHAEFEVDGDVVEYLDGETTWQTVSREISGDGPHTLLWRYKKDYVESEGEDCCWVADFQWTSAATPAPTATQTTPEPVPYTWLRGYYPDLVDEYAAYETAALSTAANGRPVWECYVAGLDPTDATDDFIATIEMVNGEPQISVGGRGERPDRVYTVEGKENLGDSWGPTNALSRFFHITVSVGE